MSAAVAALVAIGYVHRGDLGVVGREAFFPPDPLPRRNVYVCEAGTTNVRNHLAVRDVLRADDELRDAYAAVKLSLASDPAMDIDAYIARKSAVVQRVLQASGEFTDDELLAIHRLNASTPDSGRKMAGRAAAETSSCSWSRIFGSARATPSRVRCCNT